MFLITILFTIVISNVTTILYFALTFVSIYTDYKVFFIVDKKRISSISKNITYSTFVDENKNPSGFFLGTNCLGFIKSTNTANDNHKELYILLRKDNYSAVCLSKIEKINEEKKDETINIWFRRGNYFWLEYEKRAITIELTPHANQKHIIEEIATYYATVFLQLPRSRSTINRRFVLQRKTSEKKNSFLFVVTRCEE